MRIRSCVLILIGFAAFAVAMQALPGLREWIALGVVLLMDGIALYALVRYVQDPERHHFPIGRAIGLAIFSCLFFVAFIGWVSR